MVHSIFKDIKLSLSNTNGILLGEKFVLDQTRPGIGIFGLDANGKEIQEIVNKKLKYGIHRFKYDGGKLNNGMYFVLLENEGKRSGISVIKRS